MISEETKKAIRPTSLMLMMVWGTEFMCGAIYFMIVHVNEAKGDPAGSMDNPVLPIVFGLLGLSTLVAGLVARTFAFSQRRAQWFLAKQPQHSDDSPGGIPADERPLIPLAKSTFHPYLMSLGLFNSCILLGMVFAIIQHDAALFLPFLGGGLAGAVVCFPRLEEFIEVSALNLNHPPRIRESRR